MSRKERMNMIEFIKKIKEMDHNALMYLTDEEVEHIYNTTYYHHEEIVE
jgi:hypothetical protein